MKRKLIGNHFLKNGSKYLNSQKKSYRIKRFLLLAYCGDLAVGEGNLQNDFCYCPFALQKSIKTFAEALSLSIQKRQAQKKIFSVTAGRLELEARQAEKRYFRKNEAKDDEVFDLSVLQAREKNQRLVKLLRIKFSRLIRKLRGKKLNLFYIDFFLLPRYLFLPRYDLKAWDSFVLRRTKLRLNHQGAWEIVFFIIKTVWNWQFPRVLHKKVLAPTIVRVSYLIFAYCTLCPGYFKQVWDYFMVIPNFNNLVLCLKSFLGSFLFRWALSSFIVYFLGRVCYFYNEDYNNPVPRKKERGL